MNDLSAEMSSENGTMKWDALSTAWGGPPLACMMSVHGSLTGGAFTLWSVIY